jgi:hypothetical protein
MQPSFLSLCPFRRFQRMAKLQRVFHGNAGLLEAPYSILIYGSASYGYNRKGRSKLDDMDFILIIPRSIDPKGFIEITEKVFLTKLQIPDGHLDELLQGKCDICRMYGQVDGVRMGFRIICSDTFASLCTDEGSIKPLRNIAIMGSSRIVKDKEWSMKLRRYIKSMYQHEFKQVADADVLLVEQTVFSARKDRLGAFGRKLLTVKVIYDSDGTMTHLRSLWKLFVGHSLRFHGALTNDEIIDSIFRSERFSNYFRQKLRLLIDHARTA